MESFRYGLTIPYIQNRASDIIVIKKRKAVSQLSPPCPKKCRFTKKKKTIKKV
jgi:hypothetical protein